MDPLTVATQLIAEPARTVADTLTTAAGIQLPEPPPRLEELVEAILLLLKDHWKAEPHGYLPDKPIELGPFTRGLDLCTGRDHYLFVGVNVPIEVDSGVGRFTRTLTPGWNRMDYPAGTLINATAAGDAAGPTPYTAAWLRVSDRSPI